VGIFLGTRCDLIRKEKKERRVEWMGECILKCSLTFGSLPPCGCCSVSVSQNFKYPFRVL
jgi:hypothetical protein